MRVIRIPVRLARAAIVALFLAVVVAAPQTREPVLAALGERPRVADEATLVQQRLAAENAVGRGYLRALGQIDRIKALQLPVTAEARDARMARAGADLAAVRRDALVALGGLFGLDTAGAARYARQTEERLASAAPALDAPGLLLAPRLQSIVARADQVFGAVSDQAIRELTVNPSASPTPR